MDISESTSTAPMKPALGYAHHHRINQQIVLTKLQGVNFVADVQKNLTGNPAAVGLRITKNGVTDA